MRKLSIYPCLFDASGSQSSFDRQLMFTVPQATDRGQVRTPNCLFMNTEHLEVPRGWHRHWHVSCCLLCRIWFTTHINIDATEEETNVWYNRSINCFKFWEACLRNTMILRTGRVRCFWFNPLKWKLQTGRHAKLVLIHLLLNNSYRLSCSSNGRAWR